MVNNSVGILTSGNMWTNAVANKTPAPKHSITETSKRFLLLHSAGSIPKKKLPTPSTNIDNNLA